MLRYYTDRRPYAQEDVNIDKEHVYVRNLLLMCNSIRHHVHPNNYYAWRGGKNIGLTYITGSGNLWQPDGFKFIDNTGYLQYAIDFSTLSEFTFFAILKVMVNPVSLEFAGNSAGIGARGFRAIINSSSQFQFNLTNAVQTVTTRVSNKIFKQGERVSVGAVYRNASHPDGGIMDVYFNGALDNGTLTNAIPSDLANPADYYIGKTISGSTGLAGHFEQVSIWNKAFNDGDIASLHAMPYQMFYRNIRYKSIYLAPSAGWVFNPQLAKVKYDGVPFGGIYT